MERIYIDNTKLGFNILKKLVKMGVRASTFPFDSTFTLEELSEIKELAITSDIPLYEIDKLKGLKSLTIIGQHNPDIEVSNCFDEISELSGLEELGIFNEAMAKYNARNYVDAGRLFVKAFELYPDETAEYYANRCHDFITNGIPKDWDGIVNLTSK